MNKAKSSLLPKIIYSLFIVGTVISMSIVYKDKDTRTTIAFTKVIFLKK